MRFLKLLAEGGDLNWGACGSVTAVVIGVIVGRWRAAAVTAGGGGGASCSSSSDSLVSSKSGVKERPSSLKLFIRGIVAGCKRRSERNQGAYIMLLVVLKRNGEANTSTAPVIDFNLF